MSIKRFEDLRVWQKAIDLAEEVYRLTSEGQFSKDWGLKDQVRRASVSVPSNIAEGFGKYSNKEFGRFLAIANGSSYELRSQLILAKRLGYLSELEAELTIRSCVVVSKLIGGLRRAISCA